MTVKEISAYLKSGALDREEDNALKVMLYMLLAIYDRLGDPTPKGPK